MTPGRELAIDTLLGVKRRNRTPIINTWEDIGAEREELYTSLCSITNVYVVMRV